MSRALSTQLLALAVAALVAPSVASANVDAFPDGNDVPGRLDVRSVSHGHAGPSSVVHTASTFARWPSPLLTGPNRIILRIDLDGDWRDAERTVTVSWRDGALHAPVRTRAGRVIGQATVARPNGRTVRIVIRRKALGDPSGYRWRAATSFGSAKDVAPAGPQAHDFTKPGLTLLSFPDPSTNVSTTTSFPVRFRVEDEGLSGLEEWELLARELGTAAWATLAAGSDSGTQTVQVDGTQGSSYELRVVARDGQGNASLATRTVSVPLDDTHQAFAGAYASPPGTSWTLSISSGLPFFYLDTLHSNGFPGATFTYAFTGSYFAWIAQGTVGTVNVIVDGGAPLPVTAPASGQRQVAFSAALPPGAHTVTIVLSAGTLAIDGIVAR